jgi:hypothetical protein
MIPHKDQVYYVYEVSNKPFEGSERHWRREAVFRNKNYAHRQVNAMRHETAERLDVGAMLRGEVVEDKWANQYRLVPAKPRYGTPDLKVRTRKVYNGFSWELVDPVSGTAYLKSKYMEPCETRAKAKTAGVNAWHQLLYDKTIKYNAPPREVLLSSGGINWIWYHRIKIEGYAAWQLESYRLHRYNDMQGADKHPETDGSFDTYDTAPLETQIVNELDGVHKPISIRLKDGTITLYNLIMDPML